MKTLTETKALKDLQNLKTDYQNFIKDRYEPNAQSCETCPTKGACCLDAHFVNVHITKLEAVAISKTLAKLDKEKRREVYRRVAETIDRYDLKANGDSFAKTYACPLFEKNVGCLVHFEGKPAPCISHACYENEADLPPDNLQTEIENQIGRLNKRTYGNSLNYLSIPVWLDSINPVK
jgi:hypothetical protein